jgi:uncharacterized protein (TIGR02996 family)
VVARVARRKTHADLLAAILADPADLAARAVYADALQEAGDPRGEFIALQLVGRATRREKTLLAAHRNQWLGKQLAAALAPSSQFANGFLRVAVLTVYRNPLVPAVLDHDELRTVEILDAIALQNIPKLAGDPGELVARLPKLRELVIDARRCLPIAATRAAGHALTSLAVRLPGVDPLIAVLRARAFPGLRALRVWNEDPGPDALVRLASAVPLDEFGFALAGALAGTSTRDAIAIGKLAPIVPVLVVTGPWGKIRITRVDDKLAITPVDVRRGTGEPGGALHLLVTALGRDRVKLGRARRARIER